MQQFLIILTTQLSVINLWNKHKTLKYKKEGKDTQALENQIDTLVYRLYDLTDEEIAIVESKDKIAQLA